MTKISRQQWIEIGYSRFARNGPAALKVEALARTADTNKSSFYHHFGDVGVFTEELLDYHLVRAEAITERERRCKNIDPELLRVLVEAKEDLLFNRQLRVNRQVPAFRSCFEKTNELSASAIVTIWAEGIGLKSNTSAAELILNLTLENFYLQITPDTLNYEWLSAYVASIRAMVARLSRPELA